MRSRARPRSRVMSTPSTITRPASGRTRPSRWRRKTDLPPPLRPMMTVIEPSGTSRSTPRSTRCLPNDLVRPSTLITEGSGEHGAQEVVPHEDQHRREHDRLRGRPGDALGAVADVEALVRAHPRDQDAEGDRLPEAEQDVLDVDEALHLAEVRALRQPQQLDADQEAAEDPHDFEQRGHER